MRHTLISLCLLLCLETEAQQQFTDYIQQDVVGKGRVTLHQDTIITSLVNGVRIAEEKTLADMSVATEDTVVHNSVILSSAPKIKVNGFRIQVYAGGNTRQSKIQAENCAGRVRALLPDIAVYKNFLSPRWVCRVGDFRTYEEAYEVLRELKSSGSFDDAVIVKTRVQVPID